MVRQVTRRLASDHEVTGDPARGNRRVPYRGITTNDAWLHLRAAAINLRHLINLGLTNTDGCWALAS